MLGTMRQYAAVVLGAGALLMTGAVPANAASREGAVWCVEPSPTIELEELALPAPGAEAGPAAVDGPIQLAPPPPRIAPQDAHLPCHFGDSLPHSVQ